MADRILTSLRPRTVFQAGCGVGRLVGALRDRGVAARGRDASETAVAAVSPHLRRHCDVAAATEPIDGWFDLVVCTGGLPDAAGDAARAAVKMLTAVSDRILFSPDSGNGAAHGQGDHAPARWLRLFADQGFGPVLGYDATYLSPGALLLDRTASSVPDDMLAVAAELMASRIVLAAHGALRNQRVAPAADAEIERRFTDLARELLAERERAAAARAELQALASTRTVRYSRPFRAAYSRLRRRLPAAPARPVALGHVELPYELWRREFDVLDEGKRRRLEQKLQGLAHQPLLTVVMPVYDTDERYLREALDSVVTQLYANWELCVVDDCSTVPWVPDVLHEYSSLDARVRVVTRSENGHISAATNTALEWARGEWIVLLDHDDVLAEHALAVAVLALSEQPDAVLLYSDADKIDDTGRHSSPFFKPDFDPVLLHAQNYLCHMTMVRADRMRRVGGFRVGFEGSQDWDLGLRVTEGLSREQVVHVPHVLYHWRIHPRSTSSSHAAKPYAADAGRRAVADHLSRAGCHATVSVHGTSGFLRARWEMPSPVPKVSIVIPTRDGAYLGRCLQTLFDATYYQDFEVVVVDNGSVEPSTSALLAHYGGSLRVIRDDRPFNFSALVNEGTRAATGDVLCLLNDDCEVVQHDWLEEMVSQVHQDGVGVVGAKLLYPDGRVQHAGVVLGLGSVAGHPLRFADRVAGGYFGWLQTTRSLSAVTGACMVVRRRVYEDVGGFDEENLPVAFNDVDFCLRAGEAGWRVVWTPFAVLTHHESVSRGSDVDVRPVAFARELRYMEERWGAVLRRDPAYNPNLGLHDDQFSLAFPPRAAWWS